MNLQTAVAIDAAVKWTAIGAIVLGLVVALPLVLFAVFVEMPRDRKMLRLLRDEADMRPVAPNLGIGGEEVAPPNEDDVP